MARKVVAVLGTLDSKGAEFAFLKSRLAADGVDTLVIDAGVLGPPAFAPDISAQRRRRGGRCPARRLSSRSATAAMR